MTDGNGDEERDCDGSETDGDGVSTGEVDGDSDVVKSALSDTVVVITVSSRGLVVVVVVVVVVDCPFL